MNPRESPALLQALTLLDNPRGPRPGSGESLPADVLGLLRIAAGDQERVARAVAATSLEASLLREAAVFFLQQVLFAPASDSYRILGVDPGVSDAQLREHHRWLLRWLHPDRNSDPWEVVFAERVNRAWQDLRTPERRQRHDHERMSCEVADSGAALHVAVRPPRAVGQAWADAGAPVRLVVPGLRWLPTLLFGTLGVSALLAIGLLYAMHAFDERQREALAAAESGAAAAAAATARPLPAAQRALPSPTPAGTTLSAEAARSVALVLEKGRPDADLALRGEKALMARLPKPTLAPAPAPPAPPLYEAAPLRVPRPVREPLPVQVYAPAPAQPPAPVAGAGRLPPAVVSAPRAVSLAQGSRGPTLASTPPSAPLGARAAAPDAAPRASAPQSLDDRIANGVLGDFSDIYRQGDLARLDSILTPDARSARGGRDSLVAEYARLFATSEQRRLSISNVSWVDNGSTASIIATFEAAVVMRRGGKPHRSRGDLRIDLRRDSGQWRITRLAHDDNPG